MIIRRNENSASKALTELLVQSQSALRTFLTLTTDDPVVASRFVGTENEFHHLCGTDHGREIDILITNGSAAIIVECKVGDAQKPYQLEHYRDYWRRKAGEEPHVVWLVRRPQRVLGAGSERTVVVTWDQLHDSLRATANTVNERKPELIAQFCDALIAAEITLLPREKAVRGKMTKGYEQDNAHSILTSIRDSVDGLTGSVEEINNLPPAVHVGRLAWATKFADGWLTRVRFIMLPYTTLRNRKGPYGFRVTIGFFNDMYPTANLGYVRTHVDQWAKLCVAANMEFECNGVGKIRGEHNIKLIYPFTVRNGLKNLFARELLDDARERSVFDWQNDAQAIDVGRQHLTSFLKLVDQFD